MSACLVQLEHSDPEKGNHSTKIVVKSVELENPNPWMFNINVVMYLKHLTPTMFELYYFFRLRNVNSSLLSIHFLYHLSPLGSRWSWNLCQLTLGERQGTPRTSHQSIDTYDTRRPTTIHNQ